MSLPWLPSQHGQPRVAAELLWDDLRGFDCPRPSQAAASCRQFPCASVRCSAPGVDRSLEARPQPGSDLRSPEVAQGRRRQPHHGLPVRATVGATPHPKRRRGYGKRSPGRFADRRSIHERPAVVAARSRLGDWEGDTVCDRPVVQVPWSRSLSVAAALCALDGVPMAPPRRWR